MAIIKRFGIKNKVSENASTSAEAHACGNELKFSLRNFSQRRHG